MLITLEQLAFPAVVECQLVKTQLLPGLRSFLVPLKFLLDERGLLLDPAQQTFPAPSWSSSGRCATSRWY